MKERIPNMSVPPDATIRDAMRAIDHGGFGLALIVEPASGRFAGLVTDGDIRRALLNGHALDSPVAPVPRPTPRTASVRVSREEITTLFSEVVHVLPLLDEQGRVVDLAVFDTRAHLPVSSPLLGDRELQYVTECVLSGWVSSAGKFVTRFEESMAEMCGVRYAIATSNGTTALHLALLAIGVKPGDEVIVPTLTFIASANAVRYTGATPVFVDSELDSWNLDPGYVEQAITPRTKAIMAVHLYGHPAQMEPLLQIADRHGLALVEDAAEAHGARYRGKVVGGLGDVGTFSFYGNKIITTGEGGMVVTDQERIYAIARQLRDHGLTNLQAALGVAQMERLSELLDARRRLAGFYTKALSAIEGVVLPPDQDWAENVFWLYSVVIEPERFGCDRDQVMSKLKEANIETRPVFPCLHQQPIYATKQSLPRAQWLSENGLSLPSAPGMREEDIVRVVDVLRGLYSQNSKIRDSHQVAKIG